MPSLASTSAASTDQTSLQVKREDEDNTKPAGVSTTDPFSTSSHSDPLSPRRPFDKLPDEIVSHILSFAFALDPTPFGTHHPTKHARHFPLLVVSNRLRILSSPFRFRIATVQGHSTTYLVRRPWTFRHVREVQSCVSQMNSPILSEYSAAITSLFTNATTVSLQGDVLPVNDNPKLTRGYTETLRALPKLETLKIHDSFSCFDKTFKLADLRSSPERPHPPAL